MLSLTQFKATVGSSTSSTYLRAHRLISDVLAREHPDDAMRVLSAFAKWLPHIFSIPGWNLNINLMDDKSILSQEGRTTILHIMPVASTLRYSDNFPEQIDVLWTRLRLVDIPYQSNGHVTIRFLLEQSQKIGSITYVQCATKIVSCLTQSVINRSVMRDLCSAIEPPARMLPSIEHKLAFPAQPDIDLWSELDALFSEQPRQVLDTGQFALLLLANVTIDSLNVAGISETKCRPSCMLLLPIWTTDLIVQESAKRMLIQLLRSWVPDYDKLPNRLNHPGPPYSRSSGIFHLGARARVGQCCMERGRKQQTSRTEDAEFMFAGSHPLSIAPEADRTLGLFGTSVGYCVLHSRDSFSILAKFQGAPPGHDLKRFDALINVGVKYNFPP